MRVLLYTYENYFTQSTVSTYTFDDDHFYLCVPLRDLAIGEKAHAVNATQNKHPPSTQNTRIHIQLHTLHHSYIYWLKIHKRHHFIACYCCLFYFL